jgi:hypothetical protein
MTDKRLPTSSASSVDSKHAGDFGSSILNPPSDQRASTPTKQLQAEEESALSQIAVSAESAMNNIAARMANKLMRTVSQAEEEMKYETAQREMRSTAPAGRSSSSSETKTPQRANTAFGSTAPAKQTSPHADPQYSSGTRERQQRWQRLNDMRSASAGPLPSIGGKRKKGRGKKKGKKEESNHPTRGPSANKGRGRKNVSIGGGRGPSKSSGRGPSPSRSPSRSMSPSRSASQSPSRSSGKGSKKGKKRRRKDKNKGNSIYRQLFDRWFWANEFVLRNDTLLNAVGMVLKVLETTFQIDSAELAELLQHKTEGIISERNRLRGELEAERKRIFLVKQKLMHTQTELDASNAQVEKLTKALEQSEQYREAADVRRRAAEAENKILTNENVRLTKELNQTIKQRDKQKRKVRHREKALSKLESMLATSMGEVEILKRQKGREHEMVRKMANKYATMEAKVIRIDREKHLLSDHFDGEIQGLTKSATVAASQSRMMLDSANSTIADYRVQVHDWQEKELSRKPNTVAAAVKKIGIHATRFLMAIEKEAFEESLENRGNGSGKGGSGGGGSPPKPVELRSRWKALRFQVQEMREMAYGMLSGATTAQQQRGQRELDLERVVTEWKIKAKAAQAELGRERVLTKMLRRIFDPTQSSMRATLHISGTKKEKVYAEMDKNKQWNVKTGTTFTMTCCKHCGKFFIEEDSEWPFECEFGGEHEIMEEILDVTDV